MLGILLIGHLLLLFLRFQPEFEWSLDYQHSLNHNSIVNGARGSGATIRVFQHNTPSHLEKVLREQIAAGQHRTHRPWKKIFVVVEGIYSMEGELCQLPEIVSICKKYKAYVYLDEAHSIGAVGKSGRGVCYLICVDTADVDIMMGTSTKSFGSCCGYIAGSKELIEFLKHTCPAHLYATSISPPAAHISSIKVILGKDGSNRGFQKLARIRENNNFFQSELQKMGFEVLNDNDSPVMPIMLYNPAKIPAFSLECLKRNVAPFGSETDSSTFLAPCDLPLFLLLQSKFPNIALSANMWDTKAQTATLK
ncbi:Long chain base biosynthesis protein 2b, partial [Sesamum alatum]